VRGEERRGAALFGLVRASFPRRGSTRDCPHLTHLGTNSSTGWQWYSHGKLLHPRVSLQPCNYSNKLPVMPNNYFAKRLGVFHPTWIQTIMISSCPPVNLKHWVWRLDSAPRTQPQIFLFNVGNFDVWHASTCPLYDLLLSISACGSSRSVLSRQSLQSWPLFCCAKKTDVDQGVCSTALGRFEHFSWQYALKHDH
jgi:hypothetical protein